MDDDTKIVDLAERRKRDVPTAQTCLRDASVVIAELIGILEAHGQKMLIGTYSGGWTFSIKQDQPNG